MTKYVFIIFACFFSSVGYASASFISIQTSVASHVEKNHVILKLSFTNKGDEAAQNVQGEIFFEGETYFTPKISKLNPNHEITFPKNIEISSDTHGNYPLVIVTHYTDANQYPFSALSCILVSTATNLPPPDIFGKMENADFSKKGTVTVTLKNMDETGIDTTLRLVIPRELNSDTPLNHVKIPGKSQKEIKYTLENFSALPGSNYQVYALAEYKKAGRHQTVVIPGTIAVTKSKRILGMNHTFLLVFLIIFIIVFIAAQYIKGK